MSADQNLRFWDLDELSEAKQPTFKFNAKHPDGENLTAVAVTEDCQNIITGDTSGQMKRWDVSRVNFNDQSTDKHFIEKYFICAHRKCINEIKIAECHEKVITQTLIISCSDDCNINLHRLEDGVFIGQFGSPNPWNLKDMSIYDKKKPRYVRQWYIDLRKKMRERKAAKEEEEKREKEEEDEYIKEAKKKGMDIRKDEFDEPSEEEDNIDDPQAEWNNYLADNIDFSDEEELVAKGQYNKTSSFNPSKRSNAGKSNNYEAAEPKFKFLYENEIQGLQPYRQKIERMAHHKKYMHEVNNV